jgi:hypothetical protein
VKRFKPSRFIPLDVYNKALAFHQQGETLECWETLRAAGDGYAKFACWIFNGNPCWINYMRQFHWHWTTGCAFNDRTWHEIGHRAQGNYLHILGYNSFFHTDGQLKLRLPNTRTIENCYVLAIKGTTIPKAAIIHVAFNQLSTPINKAVEGAARAFATVAPPRVAAWLRHVDMPDWHEVMGYEFGTLDDRGYDNSRNFTNLGYWHNAGNLALAALMGTVYYGASYLKGSLRVLRPQG